MKLNTIKTKAREAWGKVARSFVIWHLEHKLLREDGDMVSGKFIVLLSRDDYMTAKRAIAEKIVGRKLAA